MQRRDAQTTARARELRKNATPAEKLLWSRLRFSTAVRFRRQQPIGPYIVDLYCAAARTVIELDGGSHNERLAADAERQVYLEAQGLEVIRVLNDEVLGDPFRVADGLEAHCLEIARKRGGRVRTDGVANPDRSANRQPHPPPNPLP